MHIAFGQDGVTTIDKRESFHNLPDGVVKRELASFVLAGSSNGNGSLSQTVLNEIPLKKCTGNFAYFEDGNILAINLIVTIALNEEILKEKLKEIRLIFYKYLLVLPDSAISELYSPILCQKTKSKRKFTSNCKVFWSQDKKRVYVYMLNADNTEGYEVTWVIENAKYLARVMDPVLQ